MEHERGDEDEMLFEGAQCCRCDLDLDPRTGYCPNDRCPFHGHNQDEIVRWTPPGADEDGHIARMHRQAEPECHADFTISRSQPEK